MESDTVNDDPGPGNAVASIDHNGVFDNGMVTKQKGSTASRFFCWSHYVATMGPSGMVLPGMALFANESPLFLVGL